MLAYDYNPYVLPTIDFVGGETQHLAFHVYFHTKDKPFSLTGCTCNFSVVSYRNKTGTPLITKAMTPAFGGSVYNVLTVELQASETVDLYGKYIYQICIRDIDGDVEIPKQGILYVTNNINKPFIR